MKPIEIALMKLRNTPAAGEWVYLWQQTTENIAKLKCRLKDEPEMAIPLQDFENQRTSIEDSLIEMAQEMIA